MRSPSKMNTVNYFGGTKHVLTEFKTNIVLFPCQSASSLTHHYFLTYPLTSSMVTNSNTTCQKRVSLSNLWFNWLVARARRRSPTPAAGNQRRPAVRLTQTGRTGAVCCAADGGSRRASDTT